MQFSSSSPRDRDLLNSRVGVGLPNKLVRQWRAGQTKWSKVLSANECQVGRARQKADTNKNKSKNSVRHSQIYNQKNPHFCEGPGRLTVKSIKTSAPGLCLPAKLCVQRHFVESCPAQTPSFSPGKKCNLFDSQK